MFSLRIVGEGSFYSNFGIVLVTAPGFLISWELQACTAYHPVCYIDNIIGVLH